MLKNVLVLRFQLIFIVIFLAVLIRHTLRTGGKKQ